MKTKIKQDYKTILSCNHTISLNTWESGINNNIIIVGSPGSGKTRKFIKPNILQKNTSYIITDVKGNLITECGEILTNKQDENDCEYTIKVLNLIEPSKSMHYNPFAYVHNEDDIFALAEFIINNGNEGKRKTVDSFWNEAAKVLLISLMGFVYYNLNDEEMNFNSVLKLFGMANVALEDEKENDDLDLLFERQKEKCGNCFEVRFYTKYKVMAGRTKASVLATLGSILAPWELSAIKEVVRYDEIELEKIGDRYTALFVMVSDTDDSKNFIAGILYSQLFQILCRKADNEGGRLKIPTRFLLDDFACIGVIPQFESVIASIRSREISACVILQNESQIFSRYGELARNIIGNCDTYIFMGSNELETCRSVAERLDCKISKVLNLPIEKCLIFSRNNVQCDTKYNIENHHRYRENYYFDYTKILTNEKPLYVDRGRNRNNIFSLHSADKILESYKDYADISKKMEELDIDNLTQDIENGLQEMYELLYDMNTLDSRCVGNELRSSFFDSIEEEKFYHDLIKLLDKYHYSELQVDVHVHLSELFTNSFSSLEKNKYKYRLVNQHCDFIIRRRNDLSVIMAIEIDGKQHEKDKNQIENDYYKNETFKINGIPLVRISAEQARANRGWHNMLFDILKKRYKCANR